MDAISGKGCKGRVKLLGKSGGSAAGLLALKKWLVRSTGKHSKPLDQATDPAINRLLEGHTSSLMVALQILFNWYGSTGISISAKAFV